jgi:integrase
VLIEEFEARLLNEGYKNPTVNQSARIAHKILMHAERHAGYTIPALRCWPSRLKEEPVRQDLTPAEIRAFLNAFRTGVVAGGAGGPKASAYLTALFRHAEPMFVCALHLGLARTDLLNLCWSSVDFEGNAVSIDRKKTGVLAVIPMSNAAREALLTCRGRAVVSSQFCFLTPAGRPYSEITFRRYFLQAKKIAEITRGARPHDLRHSFGCLLRSRGVDLGVIQKAMGHSTSRMTERYARVNTEALRPIADALNQL